MESKTLPKLPEALRAIVEGPGWERAFGSPELHDYIQEEWVTITVYRTYDRTWAYRVDAEPYAWVSLESLELVTSLVRRIDDALVRIVKAEESE